MIHSAWLRAVTLRRGFGARLRCGEGVARGIVMRCNCNTEGPSGEATATANQRLASARNVGTKTRVRRRCHNLQRVHVEALGPVALSPLYLGVPQRRRTVLHVNAQARDGTRCDPPPGDGASPSKSGVHRTTDAAYWTPLLSMRGALDQAILVIYVPKTYYAAVMLSRVTGASLPIGADWLVPVTTSFLMRAGHLEPKALQSRRCRCRSLR